MLRLQPLRKFVETLRIAYNPEEKANMEIARPQVPEKPPVPAKPRLRPAPPRPPKPQIPASLSTVSTTSSSAHIDSDKSHCKKPCTLQNGLPKMPSSSVEKQKHTVSARATSVETLSQSSTAISRRSPDPINLQPSEQMKGHMSPSSSLSLPASFRNKQSNKSDVTTPLILNTLIPCTSSSPVSPSFLQKSPIRHVSPPRIFSSPASPKTNNSFTTQCPKTAITETAHNTRQVSEDKEKLPTNSVQPLHTLQEKTIKEEDDSFYLKMRKHTKPSTIVVPLRKNSAPPPQRPTSPPSKPDFCTGRPSHQPSQNSPGPVFSKPSEHSSIQAKVEDVSNTDTVCPVERKLDAPPPLPKNPPRGGVPRKPRHASLKSSPSEIRLMLGQQTPESVEVTDSIIGSNTNTAQSNVMLDGMTQQITIEFNSQLHVQDSQNNDTKLLNDTSTSSASCSSIETRLQSLESNIIEDCTNKPKTRTPPKPRPRTRSILSPNNDEDISHQLSTIDINKRAEKNCNQNFIAEAGVDVTSENTTELNLAEVHQEVSDSLKNPDVKTCMVDHIGNTSQTSEQICVSTNQSNKSTIIKHLPDLEQSDTNISQANPNTDVASDNPRSSDIRTNVDNEESTSQSSEQSVVNIHHSDNTVSNRSPSPEQSDANISQIDQNNDEISATLITQFSPHQVEVNSNHQAQNTEEINSSSKESASLDNFNEFAPATSATNLSDMFDDSKINFQEEPEATCGMLKEIEELLKNKLGDIELDIENTSTKYSQIKSQHTMNIEHHITDETRISSENNACSHKSDNSSTTSPVRPPRPKRQANINKHLGSQESLNASSSECLVNTGLSEATSNGKKATPTKPKRTFLSRISRSNSDVTGMKSPEDSEQPPQEEIKPFLPPRLESLRRSESAVTCQSPPPLPPRNKPQSASLKEVIIAESEPPLLPSKSPLSEKSSNYKTEPEVAEHLEQSSSSNAKKHSETSAAQFQPKVNSPVRLRPARKAPPPPPGSPKRSATFSPGDNKQPNASNSADQTGTMDTIQTPSPTVKKSGTNHHQHLSSETDDHCYHEIKDNIKISENSQECDESSPPVLPPRACKTYPESPRASCTSNIPEQNSVKLSGDSAEYLVSNSQNEVSEPPKKDMLISEAQASSPKEQKQQEKIAKIPLIQKVAQGLGLRKSLKISKVPETSLIVNESNNEPADDSESEKASISSNTAVGLPAETEDSDQTNNMVTEDADELIQKRTPPADTSASSVSYFDRPLSEVSQQSTSSEQEGNAQNMEEIVSSGTDTEPEEDKEEIYAIRKAKKVFFIAKEIVSSEDTFVDVLKLLNIDFRQHISKSTENLGHTIIPSETLNKILDFLPQLQNFNEDLLRDLQERIENWETNPRLADIFVKKGPFLKLYSSYIRNFESATAVLEDAAKKNSIFASTLKEFELSPRCAKLALKHYMLKPIQRIPQYKLLLQDYLKHLTVGSPDYKDTVTALNIVSEVADHANDSMRHGDNVQKLLEIQRSLIGQFEVIQPGRVLLKQGELQKLSRKEMQPRMFILFNDVLLYTTPVTSGYKINNILPLAGMKVISPKLEDYKFEFNIISVQRSFTLSGSTSEEKEQWVTALQMAIEENTKKHHTFQTVKQGPQTSLLDKDFVLGHKAPLWVPDARVTMCMLCLLEFTLTWRRHHCRSCGRVVCSHCSENKAPLRYLKYESARVCDKCYENLKEEMSSEYRQYQGAQKKRSTVSQSEEDSFTSVSESTEETTDSFDGEVTTTPEPVKHDSGLSLNNLMSRFQKIRISNREKRKPSNFRPSVLKEVSANDEGSDMSGYLRVYRSRKWKRLWFVVKGKVLYTYKASEDMAATESMPLLGYEVTRMNAEQNSDLLFELTHQNNQPLVSRKEGDKVCPRVVQGTEKTNQRLIFRTDSAAATTKWVTVLRDASLHQ